MIRSILVLLLMTAWIASAQSPDKDGLLRLTNELDTAIQSGDWAKAIELSGTLKATAEDARNRSMATAGREQADSILAWFPADTETILVAQQPFELATQRQTETPRTFQLAQAFILGLLQAAEKGTLATDLAGRTLRLAVFGARRFGEKVTTEPQVPALGMIPYQGCATYSFAAAIVQPILSRPPEETILGYRVWISKGSQNDQRDRDDYFVSMLNAEAMLVCNSRAFFQEMVERIGQSAQRRALPADLPEWKLVDRSVPLWGLTHYRNSRPPLGTGRENLGATGLTVEFGLDGDVSLARMITDSDPWKGIASSRDFRGAAQSSEVSTGIWELKIAGKSDAALFTILVLMGELGFVILL